MSSTLTLIEVLPTLLRAISDALGTKTSLAQAMDQVLDTTAAAVEVGDAAALELVRLTSQINSMVLSGRDPTEEEWNALKARSDAAHATIQAYHTSG